MNGRSHIRDIIGILSLLLLLVAFFVLLNNAILGWALVFISAVLVAFSLYTDRLPKLKP